MDIDKLKHNKEVWKTPDHYFENLHVDIMEKIESEENLSKDKQSKSKKLMLWSSIVAAASVVLLLFNVSLLMENKKMVDKIELSFAQQQEIDPAVEMMTEDEILQIEDYLVDNKMIYDAIYNEDTQE
ncbi:MAG: hypothetical protein N4A37_07885 [Prolixibacteraceae bacterium]|jgi:hypothetical protein|nr:hypothetical protein [Prolixibacteraceae bacterium]